MLTIFHPQSALADGSRADPAYWHPAYRHSVDGCRRAQEPLGRFIRHLTYGAIVTGPQAADAEGGIPLIGQGQLRRSGVDMGGARRVPNGSAWDLPRARVQREDILFARSGVASVAKNRVSIFLSDGPVVVGSFVNIIRVVGIDPFAVLVYLQTEYAWAQISRIINGVGTPNMSFAELRDLQVALFTEAEQQAIRERYLAEVHPRHLAGDFDAAEEALRGLVATMEGWIVTAPAEAVQVPPVSPGNTQTSFDLEGE